MAATYTKAKGVHFVGSAPYPTASETFTRLSTALPGRLRRIPDGEPGTRNYWTWFLHSIFPDWSLSPLSYPAKLAAAQGLPDPGPTHWAVNPLSPPARPSQPSDSQYPATVARTTYADEAITSYSTFKQLKASGTIEPHVRFQVSIATSAALICTHIATPFRTEIDAALEPRVIEALQEIQAAIPAEELAIQLDLATEMGMLEHERERSPDLWFAWFQRGRVMEEVVPRVLRQMHAVQPGVELGLHFCYGDIAHEHWAQPIDTALIVKLFNEIKRGAKRRIDFVHLPVPVERDDTEYFTPLVDAEWWEAGTEAYLGLVRERDLEGTERRLAAAQKVLGERAFGVATECGLGRIGETALADDVLRISAVVAGPV